MAQREPTGLRDYTSGAGWSQGQVVEAETKEKNLCRIDQIKQYEAQSAEKATNKQLQ